MCQVSVLDYRSNVPVISMRSPTRGPELDMVKDYIEAYISRLQETDPGLETAILLEPSIAAGYPDIVIVQYDSETALRGDPYHGETLRESDCKILAFLLAMGKSTVRRMGRYLGFDQQAIESGLLRLGERGLVLPFKRSWEATRKDSFFAIKQVIAIEAKIGSAHRALEQSIRNACFASTVYSLLDCTSLVDTTRQEYDKFGVGIILNGSYEVRLRPKRRRLSACYTNLLLNECIVRLVQSETQ